MSAMDVAKSLIDAGMHPPTMYFPLIVHEALMFEPTETEGKETLDQAADAVLSILARAKTEPEALHAAPVTTPIGRPDEVGAARKVRTRAGGKVLAGFAGATADAFTLIERLEAKLEQYPDQLARACVDLAKDWRTDRYLRRLEAMLLVADAHSIFTVTGVGDVLEPEHGVAAVGSGGNYALAAALALSENSDLDAEAIERLALPD